MKNKILVSLFLVFLGISACSPFKNVYSIEEPGVNLSKYHTYNWLDDRETDDGNKGPQWLTESTQTNIRNAVENQMVGNGLKICTENPDLTLHYHVVVENKVLYVRDRTCTTEGMVELGRCNRLRPMYYQEGALLLDFIDSKSGNQVWRGVVVGAVENLSPEKQKARTEEAVEAMFKKFPK